MFKKKKSFKVRFEVVQRGRGHNQLQGRKKATTKSKGDNRGKVHKTKRGNNQVRAREIREAASLEASLIQAA